MGLHETLKVAPTPPTVVTLQVGAEEAEVAQGAQDEWSLVARLDAAWLAALSDAGGVVPRCQDVPPEAVVTLEEMEQSWFTNSNGILSALVISYPWVRSCPAPPPPTPGTPSCEMSNLYYSCRAPVGSDMGRRDRYSSQWRGGKWEWSQ